MTVETKSIRRILILDDEVFQANALKLKLSKSGFEAVDAVYTGVRAIQAIEKSKPDIVLLDINLDKENIDGIDVGNAIHKLDKDIIIIYVTAYPSEDNFQRALDSMPYAFIEKPYKMKTLLRDIEIATYKASNKLPIKETIDVDSMPANPKGFKILCFPNFILVNKGEKGHYRLALDDILHLEADNVWTIIHTKQGKKHIVNLGLKKFITEANYPQLVQTHRSYGVNLTQLGHIKIGNTGGHVEVGDLKAPVSKGYVNHFWDAWKKYFGKEIPPM